MACTHSAVLSGHTDFAGTFGLWVFVSATVCCIRQVGHAMLKGGSLDESSVPWGISGEMMQRRKSPLDCTVQPQAICQQYCNLYQALARVLTTAKTMLIFIPSRSCDGSAFQLAMCQLRSYPLGFSARPRRSSRHARCQRQKTTRGWLNSSNGVSTHSGVVCLHSDLSILYDPEIHQVSRARGSSRDSTAPLSSTRWCQPSSQANQPRPPTINSRPPPLLSSSSLWRGWASSLRSDTLPYSP